MMAKRRLTKQQKKRIEDRQARRIDKANKDAGIDESSLGPEQHGRVYARYAKHVDIKSDNQDEIIRCHVRANVDSIAVGDYVIWRESKEGGGVVVAVEPRKTVIERPDGLGKLKPVAANIDQVFIVLALEPEPHPNLIDRYLIACEKAGIAANLVLNKTDLFVIPDSLSELLEHYQGIGYPVYFCSCENNDGIKEIRQALKDKTSVFAGQSGVGKSSLVNQLLPEVNARVGSLSDHVTKGRHTTTTAELFDLPEGGYLIDSPGIREFHLTHFEPEVIFAGFRELHDAIGHCQFRDCKHDQEPGCAVKAVIESGSMPESRIQSLEYILNGLEQD